MGNDPLKFVDPFGLYGQAAKDAYNDLLRYRDAITLDLVIGLGARVNSKYNFAEFILGGELIYGVRVSSEVFDQGHLG